MAKKTAVPAPAPTQAPVQVVVSSLTKDEAKARIEIACKSGPVAAADAVHDVLFSGTGYHKTRPTTLVRFADTQVQYGAIAGYAANLLIGPANEGEHFIAHLERSGAFRYDGGMLRCKGTYKVTYGAF